ncbi:MAG: 4Fe-4S dicluster domain-containing protein [Candidatus Bathyarchaeota archaeon]|nr:MAG: 4Fe-4S dicluster domain-containing protein [Candidatus Bathyarchaeota archaeon]
MKWKVIEKSKLPNLIGELAREYEIFAPVDRKSIGSFERLASGSEVSLDSRNTKKPPKDVFIPQTETLFTYKTGKQEVELAAPQVVIGQRVVLAVRPCDAKSFVLLDKFLSSGEYKDAYYKEKRKNTTIVGLACNHPLSTCFCTSLGGSPHGKEGLDVLLQDINDKYLIEPITERGEKLIEKFPWLKEAERADIDKAKKLSDDAEAAVKSKVSIDGVDNKLDGMFDDPIWEQICQKCLNCGICTFFCPTCCCFDVLDEDGKRIRIWDSCQFSCFTLHGSGHNPRPSGKERMRQRIMHKFNYFVKTHGESFCVGCGRCIQECPVNLDIREVVGAISALPTDKRSDND